jgi:hypothetical protein
LVCSSSSGTGKRVCSMFASISCVSMWVKLTLPKRSRTKSLDRVT